MVEAGLELIVRPHVQKRTCVELVGNARQFNPLDILKVSKKRVELTLESDKLKLIEFKAGQTGHVAHLVH